MKYVIFIALFASSVSAQPQTERTGFEIGGTVDLHKLPSVYTRLAYSAPIGVIRFDAGAVILFGRDGGFGFDALVTRPIGRFEPLGGTRFLVWERSMSVGFPAGARYHYPIGEAELTFGITVAPTVHLAAEERHTVLFDTFIGFRF